ncbi:MAG TPA: hypothetical protein VGB02_13225 [Pyrinomonadaceae bacterium]|jgi:signal transduction histidine kinase
MASIQIQFPVIVNTTEFEETLKQYFPATIKRKTDEVVFDFNLVGWCGLFELSLTAIWISNLLRMKKRIKFIYPTCIPINNREKREFSIRRSHVCSFLNRWNFDTFLFENKIEIEQYDQDYPLWSSNLNQDSILPLMFFQDERSFNDFESSLNSNEQYSILFKDVLNLGIIGNKGIRDTIIREIGQNIYEHANGGFGLFTIGKISPLSDSSAAERRIKNSSPLERGFFKTLGKNGYLQVVIADNGIGIFNSLAETYQKEIGYDQPLDVKDYETKLLDYAFRFNTSRNKGKKNDQGQGRGLYWVKSLVRDSKGLLSVRSGASIIAYDFLNNTNLNSYVANKESELLKRIANLGGTQIRILFPFQPDLLRQQYYSKTILPHSGQLSNLHVFRFLEIKSYLKEVTEWSKDLTDLLINDLLPRTTEGDGLSITIVDFAGTNWTKDELFPLLSDLAQTQHDDRTIVIINSEELAIFNLASEILKDKIKENPLKFRPIPTIRNGQIELLGLIKDDEVFLDSLSRGQPNSKYFDFFRRRNEHVYHVDQENESVSLRFSVDQIEKEVEKEYKKAVKNHCLQNIVEMEHLEKEEEISEKAILFRGKFLTPSNFYSESYFRIAPLLADKLIFNKIFYIFFRFLQRLNDIPDFIVTTSKEFNDFGDLLAKQLSIFSNKPIKHIHLRDAYDENSTSALLVGLRGKSLAILSSVIGSGSTINTLIDISETTSKTNTLGILSIIDARLLKDSKGVEKDPQFIKHGSKKIQVFSIFQNSIEFQTSRPSVWRIEEIVRVDPATNTPERRIESAKKPFWDDVEKHFLEEIIAKARAIAIGHFVRRTKHYIYFFDMVRITKIFGTDLANRIRKDVDDFLRIPFGGIPPIGCVVFDPKSRGAKNMAELIAKELNTVTISSEDIEFHLQNPQKKISNNNVVIYSSATSSGTHLKRLIDSVSKFKPSNVLAYSIVHRKESDDIDFLQKIDAYNGCILRVRSFAALEIPTYHKLNCPICYRISELTSLKELYRYKMLDEAIDQEIKELEEIEISEIDELEEPKLENLYEMIAHVISRRKLGASKTGFHIRKKEITDVITNRNDPSAAKRLIYIMAKEISFISSYSEIFYKGFRESLGKYCIEILKSSEDDTQSASSALVLLRNLTPDFFIENIPLIFKYVGSNHTLLIQFAIEFLLLSKTIKVDHPQLMHTLDLCQIALQEESVFQRLPVDDIFQIQRLLLFLTGSIKNKEQQSKAASTDTHWSSFYHLWKNFVGENERVHPRLAQGIFEITGITDVALFERGFKLFSGEDGFSSLLDSLIDCFRNIRDFLRDKSARRLSYFLNEDTDSFSSDIRVLEERISFLGTLKAQGRLDDIIIKRALRDTITLEACQRLQNAFVNNNPVSQVLGSKFTKLSPVLNDVFNSWKAEFEKKGIIFETNIVEATVFVPEEVLREVLDNLLKNVYQYAFDGSTSEQKAIAEVKQNIGNIEIIIKDNGKGITSDEVLRRENRGISHSQKLLSHYDGSLNLKSPDLNEEFPTQFLLILKTKEEFFYETQNNSNR